MNELSTLRIHTKQAWGNEHVVMSCASASCLDDKEKIGLSMETLRRCMHFAVFFKRFISVREDVQSILKIV